MKRRSFLKLLSLAPAVAAAPALAMAAVKEEAALSTTGAVSFFYDTGRSAWMGYAVARNLKPGVDYEFASLFGADKPNEGQREMFCKVAQAAFERAKR